MDSQSSLQDLLCIFERTLYQVNSKFNALNIDQRVTMLILLMQDVQQQLGLTQEDLLDAYSKACEQDNQTIHTASSKRSLE